MLVLFPLPVVPITKITYLFLINSLAVFVLSINRFSYSTLIVMILALRAHKF